MTGWPWEPGPRPPAWARDAPDEEELPSEVDEEVPAEEPVEEDDQVNYEDASGDRGGAA